MSDDYTPDFDNDGTVTYPSSDADLDINYERAFMVFLELVNAGNLAPDLLNANAQIIKLPEINELVSLMTDLTNQPNMAYIVLEPPQELADAAMRCGLIANAFLDCIKGLWGLDQEMALKHLSVQFDAEPGISVDEVLAYTAAALSILALSALAVATFGTGAPIAGVGISTIMAGLALSLGAVSYAQLFQKVTNGELSATEAWGEGALIAIFTAAGLKGDSILKLAKFQNLSGGTKAELGLLINYVTTAASNTSAVPTSYYGELENIISLLIKEGGLTREEALAVINSTLESMVAQQQTIISLSIAPAAGAGHYIPVPGSFHDSMGLTPDGQGIKMQDSQSNEYNAWWSARKSDWYAAQYGRENYEEYLRDVENFNSAPGTYIYRVPVPPTIIHRQPDFFRWLADQPIPLPTGITKESILASGYIDQQTGDC